MVPLPAMIPFKNHNPGIGLIEVIVALMMVSLVIIASFNTESIMLRSTVRAVNQLNVAVAMKNFFVEGVRKNFLRTDKSQTKSIDVPDAELVYQAAPVKSSSSLKNISGMMLEKVTAAWREFGIEKSIYQARFVYKEPEEQKS